MGRNNKKGKSKPRNKKSKLKKKSPSLQEAVAVLKAHKQQEDAVAKECWDRIAAILEEANCSIVPDIQCNLVIRSNAARKEVEPNGG